MFKNLKLAIIPGSLIILSGIIMVNGRFIFEIFQGAEIYETLAIICFITFIMIVSFAHILFETPNDSTKNGLMSLYMTSFLLLLLSSIITSDAYFNKVYPDICDKIMTEKQFGPYYYQDGVKPVAVKMLNRKCYALKNKGELWEDISSYATISDYNRYVSELKKEQENIDVQSKLNGTN